MKLDEVKAGDWYMEGSDVFYVTEVFSCNVAGWIRLQGVFRRWMLPLASDLRPMTAEERTQIPALQRALGPLR